MTRPNQNIPLPDDLREFARTLRSRSTEAEQLMWGVLRARRFLGWKFRRQHPVERYILDFYCDELHWAVELDGGQHNSSDGRREDAARSAKLAEHGIVVSRYWNHGVITDFEAVLEDMAHTAQRLSNAK